MSAEIVNLNKFRKAKERVEQDKKAEQNRAKFGRTKAERASDDDDLARRDKLLDGAKIVATEPLPGERSDSGKDGKPDPGTAS